MNNANRWRKSKTCQVPKYYHFFWTQMIYWGLKSAKLTEKMGANFCLFLDLMAGFGFRPAKWYILTQSVTLMAYSCVLHSRSTSVKCHFSKISFAKLNMLRFPLSLNIPWDADARFCHINCHKKFTNLYTHTHTDTVYSPPPP